MPAIYFFIIFIIGLTYWRVADFIKIPRSKFTYGRVISNVCALRQEERNAPSRWAYYHLTIEFDNRQAITFVVNGKVSKSVSVGSRGVVEHVGTHFRKFHVDKTLAEMVNPDKKNKQDFRKGFIKKNNVKKDKKNKKNSKETVLPNRYRQE